MNGAISTADEPKTAEQRFRGAFDRLKDDRPRILPRGTPVSQNNVAKEAGTDPTALRKTRFPALVREIQAWVEIHSQQQGLERARRELKKKSREDLTEQNSRLVKERDDAQSQLTSAHRLVLELLQKNAILQAKIDELRPPPSRLKW
ncbi:hypothetical protein [Paraburkholderia phenoliruptrix]|uniref:hypothetical protein n=1 Tax=Paraburkholderia phenoliruptrix TaxID=252970 RepID=UPI00285EDF1F|nr:hypothetical protein [Paraburkholderia phenoliruptrix]MDR6392615.1 hypothetical protein [Paraburkholderia phenoliruptrix]